MRGTGLNNHDVRTCGACDDYFIGTWAELHAKVARETRHTPTHGVPARAFDFSQLAQIPRSPHSDRECILPSLRFVPSAAARQGLNRLPRAVIACAKAPQLDLWARNLLILLPLLFTTGELWVPTDLAEAARLFIRTGVATALFCAATGASCLFDAMLGSSRGAPRLGPYQLCLQARQPW